VYCLNSALSRGVEKFESSSPHHDSAQEKRSGIRRLGDPFATPSRPSVASRWLKLGCYPLASLPLLTSLPPRPSSPESSTTARLTRGKGAE